MANDKQQILQNQRDLVASLQYIAIKNNHPRTLEALNLAIKGLSELELNECRMWSECVGDRPKPEKIRFKLIEHESFQGNIEGNYDIGWTASVYNPATQVVIKREFGLFGNAEEWINETFREWENE